MNEDKDKKVYELALLLKNEEDLASVLTLVKQHNGEVVQEPRAKKLALAYKIEKETEAVFVYCNFSAASTDAKNLEHDLRTRKEIIRSMIVIATPPSERRDASMPSFPHKKRHPAMGRTTSLDVKSAPSRPEPLSNEALEKKIEEILQ
jgi:ribosomal protein S6